MTNDKNLRYEKLQDNSNKTIVQGNRVAEKISALLSSKTDKKEILQVRKYYLVIHETKLAYVPLKERLKNKLKQLKSMENN